jgi:hypothetical protein
MLLLALTLAQPGGLLALEDRLQQAPRVEFDFDVRASGAFTAELHGRLSLDVAGTLRMEAQGSFGAERAQLVWEAAEGRCRGLRDGNLLFDVETPHLREAVLLGLTRMGILHNLARCFAAAAPDHADTGIGDWLAIQNETAGADSLHFDLDVAGRRAATVGLRLSQDGLPLRRWQRVDFPGGSMEVREDYHFEIVDRQRVCPPCRQPIAAYGRKSFVEMDWSRVFVCCADCAERVRDDFAAYLEILHALDDDTERLHARRSEPWLNVDRGASPCAPCRAGLCARPEHLPAHGTSAGRPR